MDNLPGSPSDQNDNNGSSNTVPASPIGGPPPFGSSINPYSNPVDPNNPYSSQPPQTPLPNIPASPTQRGEPENPDPFKHDHYSEVAQHKQRDEHGHFIHADHPETLTSPTTPTPVQQGQAPLISQISPNPPPSSFLPPIVEINQTGDPTYKKDPPAFGFFITNPVTYFKAFLNKLIKRQAITIKIPVLAIIVFMVGIGGFGVGFSSGMNWAFARLFPNYSPLLHRSITEQGIVQKSSNGDIFLKADDKRSTTWTLKSVSANVKLEDYVNQHVQIRGNLDATPNLIEVSEVILF